MLLHAQQAQMILLGLLPEWGPLGACPSAAVHQCSSGAPGGGQRSGGTPPARAIAVVGPPQAHQEAPGVHREVIARRGVGWEVAEGGLLWREPQAGSPGDGRGCAGGAKGASGTKAVPGGWGCVLRGPASAPQLILSGAAGRAK